jgi:hypothetical protein
MLRIIGNNLKTNKKWNIKGSCNGTIVLTTKKITKVLCFKCYNHITMACNRVTKLEGSMCIQKPWKERMKDHSKPLHYILSISLKIAAT